jgi:hypothetical protein
MNNQETSIMTSTLFICRQGQDYSLESYGYFRKFSGLFNSARLMSDMLNEHGISAAVETAIDNNCIDRLVTEHRPTFCIIEAYWVVPEKFAILAKLHPDITWIIRVHSEIPFWATEGVAMEWTLNYLDYPNVLLAPNASRLDTDIRTVLSVKYDDAFIDDRVIYLPNYYPSAKRPNNHTKNKDELHVGCFGAIRPLKNQLIQAIAAIKYASNTNRKLVFHINGNRMEGGGEAVLKNIRGLFNNASNRYTLVEHAWMPHKDFLGVLEHMDIGMQVSYTESFNIVAADMVTMDIPIVTSAEISWINSLFHAEPSSSDSIVAGLARAEFLGKFGAHLNRCKLGKHSGHAVTIWVDYFS